MSVMTAFVSLLLNNNKLTGTLPSEPFLSSTAGERILLGNSYFYGPLNQTATYWPRASVRCVELRAALSFLCLSSDDRCLPCQVVSLLFTEISGPRPPLLSHSPYYNFQHSCMTGAYNGWKVCDTVPPRWVYFDIYTALGGDAWTVKSGDSTWGTDGSCFLPNVVCTGGLSGDLLALSLRNNGLSGTLPTSLSLATALT
jgi:hypothetical protein